MMALFYYFQNIFRPQDANFAAELKPDAAVALTSNSILKYSCSRDLQGGRSPQICTVYQGVTF